MKVLFSLVIVLSLFMSCSKSTNCECVPPPITSQNYKITQRNGSIAGSEATLTEDQKNSVLTISTDGKFKVKNTLTNVEVAGTYTMANITSIYGEKTRIIFTPNLPMLSNEFHIIIESQTGKFILGDNITDGFSTTFTAAP